MRLNSCIIYLLILITFNFSTLSCATARNAQKTTDTTLQQQQQQQEQPQESLIAKQDSLQKNSILTEYLTSLELQPNDTILYYVNDLIKRSNPNNDTTKSVKKVQSLIAFNAYNHFYNSPIMGQESVAIKIAQEWFLSKKLEWPNKDGLFMVNMFVEMNKHSLIGMKAPELNLTDTLNNQVSLLTQPPINTIIYFYTDDCVTCKIESPKLVNYVNEYTDGPLNVYAVYTHDNREKWLEYIEKNFSSQLYNPFINWINVYDPKFESGFHMLYNVISTPQMFLLDRDKRIIGRNLNTDALEEILTTESAKREQMIGFFSQIFNQSTDSAIINGNIDILYQKSSNEPQLFKELFYELFNFLRYSDNYHLQDGAEYLAQEYIIAKSSIWESENLISDATKWLEIYNMNPLGGDATDLQLEEIGGSPINLYDIKSEYKVLYFYKIDCGVCTHVSQQMDSLYKEYKPLLKNNLEFVAINTGKEYNEWVKYIAQHNYNWSNVWGGDYANAIYEKYYLESVPTIYLLKNNMVIAKDITDLDLAEVLQIIMQQQQQQQQQQE